MSPPNIGETASAQIRKYLAKSMGEKLPVQINVRLDFDAGHAVDRFFIVLMKGKLHICNRNRNLLPAAGRSWVELLTALLFCELGLLRRVSALPVRRLLGDVR
jgi:hypothetical protein